MALYRHVPSPPLQEHIEFFWYYVDFEPDHDREHILPNGTFELIINLQDRPRKLFHRTNTARDQAFKQGWISGAQKDYLVIDALPASSMIGAHFKPGGAAAFLVMPAHELGAQVVELDAIWGHEVDVWREQLLSAPGAVSKFKVLEQMLLQRWAKTAWDDQRHRRVSWVVGRFLAGPQVRSMSTIATELGCSHKHLIDQFRRQVGLTPKLFCRIRRFQQVLAQIHNRQAVDWAEVVFSCGYYDQAHFVNDFQSFSGVNPTAYLDHCLEEDRNYVRARQ